MGANDLTLSCGCRFNRRSGALHYCGRHRFIDTPGTRILKTMDRDLGVRWNGGDFTDVEPFSPAEMGEKCPQAASSGVCGADIVLFAGDRVCSRPGCVAHPDGSGG